MGVKSGWDDGPAAYGAVELQVTSVVSRLSYGSLDDADLASRTESLIRMTRPHPRHVLETVLADRLVRLLRQAGAGGWGAADLEQLITRHAGPRHLPLLRDLQQGRTPLGLAADDRIASGLAVAARLMSVPLLNQEATGVRTSAGAATDHPKLAQARALLAKAESTHFDEEAEALTAKAQELITRYSLGRLVGEQAQRRSSADGPGARRIWLDAPYVSAKARLVHEVASANRCRSASSTSLGYCVVVGAGADLESVDLLVTSLLAQADGAMLRHGQRRDRSGRSRTRSFRRSFLLAFATRIGDRLRTASEAAVAAEDGGDLLPVLRDHQTRVSEAFDALVPHTRARATTYSDREGWAAGVAAADLAALDAGGRLERRRA